MRPRWAVGLWAALCVVAALYGNRPGHGTRAFEAALTAFAILLAGQILLAAPAIRERLVRTTGPQGGALVALWPLGAYLIYAFGSGNFTWARMGIAAAYALVPVGIAATAHATKPGAWQDYAAMLAIVLPFEFGWLRGLFFLPELRLGYILPILFAMNVALATFLFVRRMDDIGYSIGWSLEWTVAAGLCFAAIAAIDIPIGVAIHFVRFDPGAAHWRTLPRDLVGIFVFTAWPEEFVFRGLLQNALGKTLRGNNAGWMVASVVFGLSHINHGVFPNWRYVLLATVAGLFYGLAWRRTRSIFPAAAVHTLVDTVWHQLFQTL
jgi:membrane protease YdiL (CAAX protease family)